LNYFVNPPPAWTVLRVTSNDGINIRDKPCTDGRIITTLGLNAQVISNGKSQNGCNYEWWHVKGSFGEGWAARNWLEPQRNNVRCRQNRNYPLYKQCDGRWGSDHLGRDITICKVGCLITSVAMAFKGLNKQINNQDVTPKNFNTFLRNNNGYSGNLYMWSSVSRFGFRYLGQPRDINQIKNHICSNNIVTLNVDRGGHWVLAIGVNNDGTIQILDPAPNRNTVRDNEVVLAGVYAL